MAFLLALGRVKRCIVCEESHQDGGLHVHATVEFECRKDIREHYFDIEGVHPNILVPPVGDSKEWLHNHWTYCCKEDANPQTYGDPPETIRKRKRDDYAREAFQLARTRSVEAAMKFTELHMAADLLKAYDTMYRAFTLARNQAVKPMNPAKPLSDFVHAPLLDEGWSVLYLNGGTGLGKTQYARALLPEAVVVSHRDQLREVDFSKGVILDDFDVSKWPPSAVIHLLDWDEPRGIDIKHSHVVIPAHTRKIITHNSSFERWVPEGASDDQVSAMRRRVNVVNIHSRLF